MKTIIKFPDGNQIIGEPESMFEVIGLTQMYYVAELYAFFIFSANGEYKEIEEFIKSNGEHPKFKEDFSFDIKKNEKFYYLTNCKLYLEEYLNRMVDFLNKAVKINQLSKQKYEAFIKTLTPIQKVLEETNETLAKSS